MMLDTDVLMLLERRLPEALAWLESLDEPVLVSGFAAMEMLSGCQNSSDKGRIDRLLGEFSIVWPTEIGLDRAMRQYGALRLSHGIGLLDILIASTAILFDQPLATFNERHFRAVPGLITVKPYAR